MAAFPELFLTWNGDEYRCRATMDVLTHIEQRVPLQKLAHAIVFDAENVAVSHVAWVFYCLLRGAGAQLTAEDVWGAMRDNTLSEADVAAVMEFVIGEIYGSGPEKPPKQAKKKPKSKARSTK